MGFLGRSPRVEARVRTSPSEAGRRTIKWREAQRLTVSNADEGHPIWSPGWKRKDGGGGGARGAIRQHSRPAILQ